LQSSGPVFDVLIVGGGPAGLSAGLMLGRCRRRVLLCDEGRPRNRRSRALHGYLTRDGIAPAELNALGRSELRAYGIECRDIQVTDVVRSERGFDVTLAGGQIERCTLLLIATGVRDNLPDVDGMADCYGTSVFHCPYCDGWEHRDRRLAVIGRGGSGVHLALAMKTWSGDVVLCTNGGRLDRGGRERLLRNGIEARTERIERCVHGDGMVTHLAIAGRDPVPCDAIFFTTGQRPRCNLAAQLGCAFNRRGTVETSLLCETNVPGVFVAGDASYDAQFAIVAAAEGAKAALAINQSLQRRELQP
jgi:thioredoxin reductase